MKAVIVYEGVHGPTELLAQAIGDEIMRFGQQAEVHPIEEFEPEMLDGADAVFLGSPTRHGHAVSRARDMADIIGELCSMRLLAAAFDTEPLGREHGGAAEQITEHFQRLGLTTAEPGKFRVSDAHGSLELGEIEHARAWAGEVMRHLAA